MRFSTILLALRAISRNLLRSALTVLGIVIGVAAVIAMVNLGNGATKSVTDQIASMGTNQLMIVPGQRFGPGSDAAKNFRNSDVSAIKEQITGIKYVAPVVNKTVTVIYQARNWSTSITGTVNDYFPAGNWTLSAGRTFTETEEKAGRSVCILGETVRTKLFEKENPVGSEIRVKQFTCKVIGLLKSKGQAGMGHDQDDVIIMPLRTVQRRLMGTQDVGRIMVSVVSADRITGVTKKITALLRETRKIGADKEDNFRIMDTRQLTETLTSTTKILTMLLGAVAAVSLLVGGIGIMNIMLVSVTERTREIGIRLAIGALEGEVMMQFLTEAVILSGLGGLTGILIGNGGSYALSGLLGIPWVFDPSINILSFLFSTGIGIVFGYFPARRAAAMDPIEALRYE